MKRVLTGTFLAATFAVGLAAQTTPPQNPPSTPPQTPPSSPASQSRAAQDDMKSITVTGCLKAGDSAGSYMLSDLQWGGGKDKAVGTTGSGAPAGMASATSLKLTGSPTGAKLSEHVGHKVEVTGSIDKSASGSSATTPSTPSDPASSRSASATPSLDVRTVKMVAATCTP